MHIGATEKAHKHLAHTVVAEMITELIWFEPEICIGNGNQLKNKKESISAMRDFLSRFPQICLCNGNFFFSQRDFVSAIESSFAQKKCLSVIKLDTTVNNFLVTPVTDPPGRVPGRKCLCSLGSEHSI